MTKIANAINLNDSGIAIFNAPMGRFFGRTLSLTGSSISITNPDGVGGNPDFSVKVSLIDINDFAGILSVTKGGTGVGTLTQNSVLLGNGTNPITSVPVGTNGQLLIGATGTAPAFSTLEVLGGLTLTPGPNTLTLTAPGITITGEGISITGGDPVELGDTVTMAIVGGGTPWVEVTGTNQTIVPGTGYIANNPAQVVFTPPPKDTVKVGDIFYITGNHSAGTGGWVYSTIGSGGQDIRFGNTMAVDTLTSTNQTDSVLVVCVKINPPIWLVISCIGDPIIA